MNVAMSVGLAFAAIIGVCLFVLWYGSATVIDKHEDRITVMERRWAETFGGPEPAVDVRGRDSQARRITNVQVNDDVKPDAKAPPGPGDSAKNSPVALGGADTEPSAYDPDASTDEFPALPATEPSGIAIQVHAALIERPSPVPRGKSAEWVEAELARFNFTGRDR